MESVTLRQLRYVEALARHGHFGKAAAAVNVSQPALSVQIKELEEALGVGLFERSPRHVRPTQFGEALIPRARDILRAVGELGDLARAARAQLVGRFRIGVIPTIAPYLLPDLVARLGRTHPDLDLILRETLTGTLITALKEGALDAAILALPTSEPTLTEVDLFTEAFVLVRPEADAARPVPSPEALREMRLLLLEEGHCFRDQALAFCAMPTLAPRDGFDGSSLSTLVQMVSAGLGVTLIPEMAVNAETRGAPLSTARFGDPQPTRRIGMVWRRSNPMEAQLRQVSKDVTAAAQAMRARMADQD